MKSPPNYAVTKQAASKWIQPSSCIPKKSTMNKLYMQRKKMFKLWSLVHLAALFFVFENMKQFFF